MISDGKSINIIPKTFFDTNKSLKISIKGTYFKKQHWLRDNFDFLKLKKLKTSITINKAQENNEFDFHSYNWLSLFIKDTD